MTTHYDPNEQIRPELLSRLAQQARKQGDTVNGLLQRMLDNVSTGAPVADPVEMTPRERAKAWLDWTNNHSVSVPNQVDVSRESIYTREDETL